MLEQQSTVDATMALRMISYAGLSYQTLLNGRQISLPLPPVLPVVLYSGPRRWRASRDMAGLLDETPADLRPYQPQMRYLLIHEQTLMSSAGLPGKNLAVLLFRLGRSRDVEQWRCLLHTLIQTVQQEPEHAELNRSLTLWLHCIVRRSAPPAEQLPPVKTLQELDMMITEKPGLWAQQWLKEGRQEGRLKGQAELLLGMIQRRFGPVPDNVTLRIHAAKAQQIKAWSLNFVDAETLEDVLRD
ncbi:Rpn family recombination-promoting nuclease/putative transposase [Castellaniella ginsengisoli]|uniref:Rpn family recombination-promoting nuclease/putative transposase n=1 Tax=Castellaniella ginsengisoli TaxID=546114 RepID=A0AB39GPA7_9BURK